MESEATLIIRPRGQRYISMLDPRYDKLDTSRLLLELTQGN